MENPRLIQKRVKSARNIGKITKALEMVSAARVQKAQDKATSAKPYAAKIYELVQSFGKKADWREVPLLRRPQKVSNQLFIVVSTNRGLAGSLNTNLFRFFAGFLEKEKPKNFMFVNIGKKGRNFALKFGNLLADYSDVKPLSSSVSSVTSVITEKFLAGEVDEVYVVYNDFVSALSYDPRVKKLLPLDFGEQSLPLDKTEYNFEPAGEIVMESLLPYYLETEILEVFYEAEASEHSARMIAMKNASDNASELSASLTLEYNGARQTAITTEINDIVTANLSLG
jgi:F-type H+-transporting ATPase subunit gamma